MKTNLAVRYRIPMLIAGFISMVFGIYIGLIRLGWQFPLPLALLPSTASLALHGPLMVCGFLGTVISLERAVAIGERWAYLAPLAAASGTICLISGIPPVAGTVLISIASLILCIASVRIFMNQRALFTFTLLLAAICWSVGCVLWLSGFNLTQVIPWWMGFLVITIVGERLELSRFLRPSRSSKSMFAGALVMFFAGAIAGSAGTWPNYQWLSASLVVMTLWLIRNDIVRHTIRQHGLTRYIAVALSCGYAWLLAAGIIGICLPELSPGSSYDAFTHAIFLGFVFSMIFGHAPIIFPAIARIRIHYHASFYLPLIILQVSLLLRVSGDLLYLASLRKAGAIMHTIAILLFIAILVSSAIFNKNDKNVG